MTHVLRTLDLFSGIGGFSLGLERTGGFKTIAFCEIDPFCRAVLAKHWPRVPCYDDIRTLTAARLAQDGIAAPDVICGGYPCQPFSQAGKRRGAQDDRHLWPEMRRLVAELRPAWVIGENVAGHITMGLDDVLSDLEALSYACRTFVIPAVAVDAKHIRERCWIIAHAIGESRRDESITWPECSGAPITGSHGTARPLADSESGGMRRGAVGSAEWPGAESVGGSPVANTDAERQSQSQGPEPEERRRAGNSREPLALADAIGERGRRRDAERQDATDARQPSRYSELWQWLPEPDVGRVAHGVPNRVHRLRSLGNAVLNQIPEAIGRAILAAHQG